MKNLSLRASGLFLFLSSSFSFAQTFTGTGGTISDNGLNNIFSLNVTGLSQNIDTVGFGLESVMISINHNNVGDLDVSVFSPDGNQVVLTSRNGGTGNNYTNTYFASSGANPVYMGTAPFSNTYRPQADLGWLNNKQSGNGTWKLVIKDISAGFAGTLVTWRLTFGSNPSKKFPFFASNLPIVVINSVYQILPDTPKVQGTMGIIYKGTGQTNYISDPFNHYNGNIGIEVRGSTSQQYPKKAFSFETRCKINTLLDTNVSLLGMPKEHDWILYAPYPDKTFLRNKMTYYWSTRMGHYATRGNFCEVIYNGAYIGVYELQEQIKRDSNRVNISKLLPNDLSGDSVTGGYIIKVDKVTGSSSNFWLSSLTTKVRFLYDYPEDLDIMPQQQNYIQAYVDSFELALNGSNFMDPNLGWRRYGDASTFCDFMILQELGRTVDGYRSSAFMRKEKITKGGKLKMGPMWDFNLSYGNANYCSAYDTTGWQYNFNNICNGYNPEVPFWWKKLTLDSTFNNQLRCRWESFRSTFMRDDSIDAWIDAQAVILAQSQVRNYQKWPILGVYVNWNQYVGPTYQAEINYLKTWTKQRAHWLDKNFPGKCSTVGMEELSANRIGVQVIPNPMNSSSTFYLDTDKGLNDATFRMYDVTGREVKHVEHIHSDELTIQREELPAGLYFYRFEEKGAVLASGKLAVQ